jgi:hypothetical protein
MIPQVAGAEGDCVRDAAVAARNPVTSQSRSAFALCHVRLITGTVDHLCFDADRKPVTGVQLRSQDTVRA